ncbi:MAG: hypothetical protein FWH38_01335, partial [Treponema sp.]|nr:hypothetical protein [Treponema sp.]
PSFRVFLSHLFLSLHYYTRLSLCLQNGVKVKQFHSELKNDMGVERLPSGKLAVNKIVLAVAMNAYNALRLIGQKSIEKEGRKKVKRKRVGKVIRDLICVAGKLVKHAGVLVFKIHEKDPILSVFLRLNAALDSP